MKYYKLMYNYKNDEDAVCLNVGDTISYGEYNIGIGKKISHWSEITMYYEKNEGERMTDYLGNDMGWIVVSKKAKKIIKKYNNKKIQFLPVKIKEVRSDKILKDYFVVNVYHCLDALVLDESDYSIFKTDDGEEMLSIKKYVLDGNKIKGHDIFKLKNKPIPVFLSQQIVTLIKNNNLSGFDFLEVKVV